MLTLIFRQNQIKFTDIAMFFRQLAILIGAGISIIQSCELLEKSHQKKSIRIMIYSIKKEILSGRSFSYSLSLQSNYFNAITCQLIQIGEQTGKLDLMLFNIANHYEKSLFIKRQIKQALFYPSLLLIVALVITFSIFIFVIPKFSELFNETQQRLPMLTFWIFQIALFLQKRAVQFIIGMIFLMIMLFQIGNQQMIKWKNYREKIPVIKSFIQKIVLITFSRNLALMLNAGMPLLVALKLSVNPESSLFAITILSLRKKISTGLELHQAMADYSYFPPLMTQMIKIGEQSGKLDYMLEKIADMFENEVESLIKLFSQLLEPLIMLVLGVLIGGLTLTIYLPVFRLGMTL